MPSPLCAKRILGKNRKNRIEILVMNFISGKLFI